MSHEIGQPISGGLLHFAKARCEFAEQTKPHSEIGAARVIAAVTANARNRECSKANACCFEQRWAAKSDKVTTLNQLLIFRARTSNPR